ncbi:MAG TPA: GtrA family protein [Rhizobiaceae bacterium]
MIALAATLLFLGFCAVMGFPSLASAGGDNDSVMRLVQVRDLLAGQAWFDLTQYRMGSEGGLPMHWSRLVDLPIALLIASAEMLTGDARLAEEIASVVWPVGLFGMSLYLILKAARTLGGEWGVLPAAVIGALALYFLGIFKPAGLDHHNLQLTLALATLLFLMRVHSFGPGAALAGLCAAGMLAVGMETVPYVAVAGACVAVLFLLGGRAEARIARDFGAAFALVSAILFPATIPMASWFAAQCDAFSLPQASIAMLGGCGLALAASLPVLAATRARRAAALAVLAAALAALVLLAFPQCLADPYVALDGRLRSYWLDKISEAQSAYDLLLNNRAKMFGSYVTPLIALGVLAWGMVRRGPSYQAIIVAAFLSAAVLVSFWQVRGTYFSLPFAVIPLSSLVGTARRRAHETNSARRQLAMAAAWIVSLNMIWQFAAASVGVAASAEAKDGKEGKALQCYANSDYARVATLPRSTVLAVSNLGPALLRNTHHRVLAGSYHRNLDGNLATLDAFTGPLEASREIVRANDIGLVAFCRGNSETGFLAESAPEGLLARLAAGDAPDWLEIVPESKGEPLEVYRVLPGS